MAQWRFLPLEVRNGFWNMAFDEAILNAVIKKKSPYTIRFYKWSPSTVSIGRNQSLSSEVDMDLIQNKGFNVVRRISGGGAVFHDEFREITYSIVCPIRFLEDLNAYKIIEQFELIETGIIAGLKNYGLNPKKGIIHCPAIFIDGKKFSGNAQIRKKGYLLQHGTILLDINPELMYSVLKAPNNVSRTKMVKSVYSKCIGLKKYLRDYDETLFLFYLKKGFEEKLGIKLKEGSYKYFELKMAKKLYKEKYTKESWLNKYE